MYVKAYINIFEVGFERMNYGHWGLKVVLHFERSFLYAFFLL